MGKKNPKTPYLLLLPAVFLFCMFVIYPFIRTIYLSVMITNADGTPVKFVGKYNYARLLTSADFWKSIGVSFRFALMVGIPTFVIATCLALLAMKKTKGSGLYEVMYSMPLAVASAPASVIWYMIFNPAVGILNHLLHTDINWLADSKYALPSVAAVTVWSLLGTSFLFLLTGFRNVPTELLESADVDGIGYFGKVFHVIFPVASPLIFYVVFLITIQSFQTFAQIKLLTMGRPSGSTETLVFSLYRQAFQNSRWETACALSVILFLIIFAISRIEFLFEKKVNY